MREDPLDDAERHCEKQQAADHTVEPVESGMAVGLGGGNTAILMTWRIGQLLHEGRSRDIMDLPCSSVIGAKACGLGIPITLGCARCSGPAALLFAITAGIGR
jgi:ribose 5-phosphate isomerase